MIGLEIRDSSGNIIMDASASIARTISSYYIYGSQATGSFFDARAVSGRFFYQLIRANPANAAPETFLMSNTPIISIDGSGNISWTFQGATGTDHYIIYGVY